MILNGVLAAILRYSTEFDNFKASYVQVVGDRPHTVCDKNAAQRI